MAQLKIKECHSGHLLIVRPVQSKYSKSDTPPNNAAADIPFNTPSSLVTLDKQLKAIHNVNKKLIRPASPLSPNEILLAAPSNCEILVGFSDTWTVLLLLPPLPGFRDCTGVPEVPVAVIGGGTEPL